MASTIIDSFLVSFGIDPSKFVQGAEEIKTAEREIGETIEETNKTEGRAERERERRNVKAVEGYRKIRRELLSMFAVFTAGRGIKNWVSETVGEAANLGFLAANLKTSTQELTAWQRASERAGGSAAGITEQLRESADALAQLQSGMGPTDSLQWFARLGGDWGKLKDGNTFLLERSRIVHDLFKTDPAQAALMARNLGITEDQFDFIKQGPAAINALVEAQRKNAVITEQDAASALELKNKYLDLTQSLEATSRTLLVALLPAFTKIIGHVEDFTRYATENKEVVGKWGDEFVRFFEKGGGWDDLSRNAKAFAGDVKEITANIKELMDRWDEWTGKKSATTPGMARIPHVAVAEAKRQGEIGVAQQENAAPKPYSEQKWQTQAVRGWLEFLARTGASLGNKKMGEYVRNTTGSDDYLVGPRTEAGKPATPPAPGGKAAPRGIRNNNPGNLEHGPFTRSQGATGSDGRFATFATPDAGIGALRELLKSYDRRGINTVDAILKRYAPASENNTGAYAATVAKSLGVERGQKLNINDPTVMQKLVDAIIQHENGTNPYRMQAQPLAVAQQAASVAAAARPQANRATAGGTSTTTVNVENLNVQTRATDAAGIARDIKPAMQKLTFANQAASGVNR